MKLDEIMLKRRSIRKFIDKSVEEEKIEKLLHYGMSGPSACNKMPWEFYVVTRASLLEELRKTSHFTNISSPLAIVVAGNLKNALQGPSSEYWIQDCSAAMENILLGAVSLEMGGCWCGIHPKKEAIDHVRKALNIPDYIIPLGMAFIGYPNEEKEMHDSYTIEKIHYYN